MFIALAVVAALGALTLSINHFNTSSAFYLSPPCATPSATSTTASDISLPTGKPSATPSPSNTPTPTSSPCTSPSNQPTQSPEACLDDPAFPPQVIAHTEAGKTAAELITKQLPTDVSTLGNALLSHISDSSFGKNLANYILDHPSTDPKESIKQFIIIDLTPFSSKLDGILKQYTNVAANAALAPLKRDLAKLDHHYKNKSDLLSTSRYGNFSGSASYDVSALTGAHLSASLDLSTSVLNKAISLNAGYHCDLLGSLTANSHATGEAYATINLTLKRSIGDISLSYNLLNGSGKQDVNLRFTKSF